MQMGCLLLIMLVVGLLAAMSVPFTLMLLVGVLLLAFGWWLFKISLWFGIGYVLVVTFILMCC